MRVVFYVLFFALASLDTRRTARLVFLAGIAFVYCQFISIETRAHMIDIRSLAIFKYS